MIEKVVPFTAENMQQCIDLYLDVFTRKPWNEQWTEESAKERLTDLLNTPKFIGYLFYDQGDLIGMIAGHAKKSYSGMTFYVAELCVSASVQGKGYGSAILSRFENELQRHDINSLYLLTATGGAAQAFYEKNGYAVNDQRVVLKKSFV
ncbi:GNAT family N-acetyltransferase [Priestia aryabhattai]|uniref:GNAT family N-acetyltransferase n=1 Tax=Priestia TaxID=2800373 RepID=UPI0008DD8628|nr:GNAT family N-acetyltransferase [Priestia aryabhattai]MBX9967601.1 GNAT family N-acetyltransferase [Priestia aryabhattai]MBZ6486909.1 GNAT family N-acetyltransferase [Priestia aryabhattai]MDH3113756.1 GNAT family N-acetyltransferase [Priestia aryabhattai]MDH3127340.1 GNAT family N-acetyltransferase [Priestia aryabhattai]MDH3132424.1 GNAT family N-acetyltransferase [Priestia aryabhattai]